MCQKKSLHVHAHAFMPSPGCHQKLKKKRKSVFFCFTGRAYKKHFSVMRFIIMKMKNSQNSALNGTNSFPSLPPHENNLLGLKKQAE